MTTRMLHDEMILPTRHGGRVSLCRPEPGSFDIRDIAAGLARRYRWSAQSDLTVAQHSLNVSARLTGDDAQWGLMHDAAEAYLPDVPRPLKARLMVSTLYSGRHIYESFSSLESRILLAMAEQFGLPWPIPQVVLDADDRELAREARDLFGDAVAAGNAYPEPLVIEPSVLMETKFLRRFAELFEEVV